MAEIGVSPAVDSTVAPAAPAGDSPVRGEGHRCPLCEYDLRGLTEPRCPECGYRFEWADLLDPRKRLHPYLFEHHADRNFWSFWKTAWYGWGPWLFWSSLYPTQPSRPGRLRAYAALVLFVAALAPAARVLRSWVRAWLSITPAPGAGRMGFGIVRGPVPPVDIWSWDAVTAVFFGDAVAQALLWGTLAYLG